MVYEKFIKDPGLPQSGEEMRELGRVRRVLGQEPCTVTRIDLRERIVIELTPVEMVA